MRLGIKITAAFWVGILLVLGASAIERFWRDAALFEADMQRDHVVMGRGIASAVGEVWEDEGRARALDIVERANQREADITIRWVNLDPERPELSRAPVAPPAVTAPVAGGQLASWKTSEDGGRLYSYVPVQVDDRWSGALELSEALTGERAYVRASLVRVGLTTGALAVVSGAIAVVVGVWGIGRPVRLLVERVRQVGEGNFEEEVSLPAGDELGFLAQEINAMSRRLAEARVALEAAGREQLVTLDQLRHAERIATIGKLASGVAHELGTPLNVVAWRAKKIASGRALGEAAQENAAIIEEQTARMTKIVRQLLDYARRQPAEMAAVEIGEVVRAGVALLEPIARKQGASLILPPPEPSYVVRGDASQLQQVVTNLVLNALQAMGEGGAVTITLAPSLRGEKPGVELEVRDTGAGISPEHTAQIFDPFFTTKPVGEGTGLGLSVVWGILQEHGGQIAVESALGRGTTVRVWLEVP